MKKASSLTKVLALSLGFAVAGITPTSSVQAATQTWDGTGDGTTFDAAANWTNDTLPSVVTPDTALFDGLVGGSLSLTYAGNGFAGVAGNGGITLSLSSLQTGSLAIDSGANLSALRLAGITIAGSAGAFTLGNGSGTFNVTMGGAAGTQTFSNDSTNAATINSDVVLGTGGGGAHTYLFTGTGNWVLNNIISNSSGTVSLSKTGIGTTTLNAANTFSGATTISTGTLQLGNANALQNSTVTISVDNGLAFSTGIGTFNVGGLAGANNEALIDTGANAITLVSGNSTSSYSGILSGSGGLTKNGIGTTQTLTGANTYTGATTLTSGTINLGGSTANGSISSSSALSLGGGALTYTRTGTNTQTFNGTTVTGGYSNVNTTVATDTLALGALTQTAGSGGAVNFTTTGTTTTTTSNTNGIIGGWATLGNSGASVATADFAANNGSGTIVAATYTTVSGVTAPVSTQNWTNTALANANVTGSINSLKQQADFSVGSGATLTLNSGGLIMSGISRWFLNNGAGSTAGTGKITSGLASGELFLDVADAQYNSGGDGNNWRIWTAIVNGANPTVLVKTGPGAVSLLNGSSTYSGGTIIDSGILGSRVSTTGSAGAVTAGPIGTGALTINRGGAYEMHLQGSDGSAGGTFLTLANALVLNGGALWSLDGYSHATGNITVNAAGGFIGSTYAGSSAAYSGTNAQGLSKGVFVDGVVSGSGNLVIEHAGVGGNGALAEASGANTNITGNNFDQSIVMFTNNANTYSGTISVTGVASANNTNYLGVNGNTVLQFATVSVTGTNGVGSANWGASPVLFETAGTASVVGDSFTFGALTGGGNITLTEINEGNLAAGNSVALTVGGNNSSTTYSGILSGGGSLTKSGSGTFTLSGANTYTGNTLVSSGTLVLSNNLAIQNSAVDTSSAGAINITGFTTPTFGGLVGSTNLASAITNGYGSITALTLNPQTGITDTYSGIIANGASGMTLTKSGAGTQILTGSNTYTGATTISTGTLQLGNGGTTGSLSSSSAITNSGNLTFSRTDTMTQGTDFGSINGAGSVSVNSGTVAINGSLGSTTASGNINVGQSGNTNNARLNIQTGSIVTSTNANINVGNGTSTANGNGAVYQSGGTVSGVNQIQLGAGTAGSYGYYNLSGGTINLKELDIAGGSGLGNVANGVLNITSGTMTVANWIVPARGTGAGIAIMNMTGGTLNYNGGNEFSANWNTGGSTFVLNIANANLISANAVNLNLMRAAAASNLGEVNLLSGGLLQVNGIAPSSATGTSLVNFNGGTLKASTANATFLTTNLTAATVYSGGGTIDNNGVAITIPKALLAASGSGVSTVAVSAAGSGYLGAPAVTFSSGGGTGAAGYAVVSSGTISSIVITNPGTGYTSAPTVTLTGGGGSGATLGTPALTTNASGGMAFTGTGTTTLTAASTYTGTTSVIGGTLNMNGGTINSSASIVINGSGAKFLQTSGTSTPAITLTQGTVDGIGTVGAVTVGDGTGGIVTNGNGSATALTIGSLTFNGVGTINVNTVGSAGLAVTGALNSGAVNTSGTTTINAIGTGGVWSVATPYDLITYGSLGGQGFGKFALGTLTGYGARFSGTLGNSGTSITLTLTGDTPKWTGLDSGNWVVGTTGTAGNWKLVGALTQTNYIDGDTVLFDDTASTTAVNISAANVSPTLTTFGNDTKNYTVSSSGTFGVAGTGPLIKSGTGSVTLTTVNTYTGATTINNGTLQIGDGTTDGSISTTSNIVDNGTLVYNRLGSFTYGGVISGTGAVVKSGTGTQILTATNTYSGGTTINAGTLQLTNVGTTGTPVNNGTYNLNGGNFQINIGVSNFNYNATINQNADATFSNIGAGQINYTGVLTASSNVLNVNTGASRLYMNGTVSGVTQFNVTSGAMGFDLNVGNQGGLAPVNVSNGASLYFANASNFLFNNITLNGNGQAGVGALFQEGTASPTLSGSITLASDSTIGGSGTSGGVTVSGIITGLGALTKVGTSKYILSSSNNYAGPTTIVGGALQANDNAALSSGTVSISAFSGAQLALGGGVNVSNPLAINGGGVAVQGVVYVPTGDATYSGPINITGAAQAGGHFGTGGGILTVSGPITSSVPVSFRIGTVVVSSTASSYTAMAINQGTVQLGANNAIPTGATVDVGLSGAATLDLAGFNQTLVGITKNANAATVTNSVSGTATLTTTGVSTYAGVLQDGAGALALNVTSGALTLSNSNSYSGGTSLNAGTLTFGNNSAFGAGTLTLNGGTLKSSGAANIALANNIAVTGASILDMAGKNLDWNGNLSGSATLTLTTSGAASTLTLSGSNGGYGGTFTANNNNAVSFTSANAASASAAWVFNDATVDRVRITISGTNTINFGSLAGSGQIQNDTASSLSTISVGALGTNTTFSGTIKDNGTGVLALTKTGTGSLTLTGTNTYTGGTIVTGGTLDLAHPNGLNGGTGTIRGTLTVNAGATVLTSQFNALGYNPGIETTAVNINGGILNNTSSGDQGYGTTYNLTGGTMTSNGGVSSGTTASLFVLGKQSGGADAVNTFASGTTSTIAGRVNLAGENSNPIVTFTVADGAATTDLLISAAITQRNGPVGITKAGAGTMALTGSNSYTGLTDVQNGTLSLGNSGGTLADTAPVQVSGGVLDVAQSDTVGVVTLVSGTISGANTLTGNSYDVRSGAISAMLSGTAALTKTTTGTVTLSGSNSYTGLTTVSNGTLEFGQPDASVVALTGGLNVATSGTAVLTAHTGGAANVKVLDLSALTISGTTPFIGDGGKDLGGLASPAPVPEPGTIGLLAVGAIGGLLLRRRNRKSGS